MSRRLIKDDMNTITNGAGTGSENVQNKNILSGISEGEVIKAYKGVFQSGLDTANITFTTNTISVSNPNESGSKISISAPALNLLSSNITLNSDQPMSYTDILTSRVRLATPLVYVSNSPSNGDIGMVFQYLDSNLGTNSQAGFIGFNSKDKKFRLYSSTNRPIESIQADNTYFTREQYLSAVDGKFDPVINNATVNYLGDLQLRELEAKKATFYDNVQLKSLSLENGALIIDPTGKLDMLNNFTINNGIFTVDAITGDTTIGGRLDLTSNFSVNNNKFIVNSLSGNTTVGGTLTSLNDLIVGQQKFIVNAATGNTTINGELKLNNDIFVNGNKVIIDSDTGNTTIGGTLKVSGIFDLGNNFAVNGNKFTVNFNTGNTTIAGSLDISKNLIINGDKFVVDPSGNTFIKGILDVSNNVIIKGILDVSNNVNIKGSLDISNNLFVNNNGYINNNLDISNNLSVKNNGYINNNLDISNNLTVKNDALINNNLTVKNNATIYGTLDISDNLIVNNNLSVNNDANIYGTLDISDNLIVNNDAFIKHNLDISNNLLVNNDATINGVLNLNNNLSINNKFNVDGQTGDTTIKGILNVEGSLISNNFAISGNTFSINAATGNTTIAGTLDISKNLQVGNTLTVDTSLNAVSINTTDKSFPLNVGGDINITGNYRVNGEPLTDAIPVGTIIPYGNELPPSSWLKCDGSEISKEEYPDLFQVIGTTYGNGNGTTTFNLPDLRGRDVIGSGKGNNLEERNIGNMGGEEKHILSENELPSHTHEVLATTSIDGGEYSHEGVIRDIITGDRGGEYKSNSIENRPLINPTGENQAFNVMQPYTVCNYIIKAVPILTMFGLPFNHWTKTENDKIFHTGSVGIGTISPQAKLHVNGDILQSEGKTTLQNVTVEGYLKEEIKDIITTGNLIELDLLQGSNFTIDLDSINGPITLSFKNINIGQKGEIYLFDTNNNRNIYFNAPIKFVKDNRPTILPATMSKISYTVVKTSVIACKFEIFEE